MSPQPGAGSQVRSYCLIVATLFSLPSACAITANLRPGTKSLDVLDLLAHLFDQHLELDG